MDARSLVTMAWLVLMRRRAETEICECVERAVGDQSTRSSPLALGLARDHIVRNCHVTKSYKHTRVYPKVSGLSR
jgi:hypothetical protein